MLKSVAVVALALALVYPTFAIAQETAVPQKSLPEQIVDAFNGLFGVHPGARSNHAKGVILEGTFTPAAKAASVSKAVHLQKQKKPIPMIVRFSDATGIPTIPDNDPNARPHGIALKFSLPDGSKTDIVGFSFNGFPVATAEEFRDFLLAIGASGPDAPHPTPIEKFLSGHPAAAAFATAPKPVPVSYGTLSYFGVNTFKFTNAKGTVTFGRYQILPVAGEKFLAKEQTSKMSPDSLIDEIGQRVHRGPVKFKLFLQLAEQGDKLDDPSIAWPDSRKKIELGTISITKTTTESHTSDKLLFLPGTVVSGSRLPIR